MTTSPRTLVLLALRPILRHVEAALGAIDIDVDEPTFRDDLLERRADGPVVPLAASRKPFVYPAPAATAYHRPSS